MRILTTAMRAHRGARRVDRGAIWAFTPVVAIIPFSLLALFVIWLPIGWATALSFWWFVLAFLVAGLGLFVRPIQVLVLTPLLGARRPTPGEAAPRLGDDGGVFGRFRGGEVAHRAHPCGGDWRSVTCVTGMH